MSAAFDDYVSAVERFERVQLRIAELDKVLQRAQTVLKRPGDSLVSNIDGYSFGEAPLLPNSPALDARAWPKIEDLAAAVSGYHTTKADASRAYDRLSETERSRVNVPNGLFR
ncbi:MAG: hypothetical protein K8U03_09100 [Planctomycetia bacterium]|nr:hypothetical protein [Planctomycetia bacterium]